MKAVGHAWKVSAKHNCADGDRCPMHGYWLSGYRYNYGLEPPHYPVPALYDPNNKWHWYWTMPSWPLRNLIAGWHMWNATR